MIEEFDYLISEALFDEMAKCPHGKPSEITCDICDRGGDTAKVVEEITNLLSQ